MQIDSVYKPNTRDHFNKWKQKVEKDKNIELYDYDVYNPFVSNIEDMPEKINELIMEMDNDYLHFLALKGQIAVKLLFNESVIMSKFDELYRSLVLG